MNYLTDSRKELLVLRTKIESAEHPVYAESTDKQLVDLAIAGDESAFQWIFDRHKRRIAVIAGRYFERQGEIEEVIQISFITAYTNLGSFRGLHDFSLASWLNRIAINTCLKTLKERTRKNENLFTELSDQQREAMTADLIEKSSEDLIVQRDLLEKLLSSLKADDRVVLQMLHAQGMSVEEVGEIFGWSRAKVKIRAFRARRSLSRIIRKLL